MIQFTFSLLQKLRVFSFASLSQRAVLKFDAHTTTRETFVGKALCYLLQQVLDTGYYSCILYCVHFGWTYEITKCFVLNAGRDPQVRESSLAHRGFRLWD